MSKHKLLDIISKHFKWLVGALVCSIIAAFGAWLFQNPPSNPDIKIIYDTIQITPLKYLPDNSLDIDSNSDRTISAIKFAINNKGTCKDNNFKINITTNDNSSEIVRSDEVFIPTLFKDNVKQRSLQNDKKCFFRWIDPYPPKSKIYYFISFSNLLSINNIKMEFLSDSGSFCPQASKIDIKKPFEEFENNLFLNSIFTQDNEAPAISTTTYNINQKLKYVAGSYYPIRVAYRTYIGLRDKNILSKQDINEIDNLFYSHKSCIINKYQSIPSNITALYLYFDFIRFYELILNALINKKILSSHDAENILNISRNAGDTLISGYNIIVIDIEINNILIRKGVVINAGYMYELYDINNEAKNDLSENKKHNDTSKKLTRDKTRLYKMNRLRMKSHNDFEVADAVDQSEPTEEIGDLWLVKASHTNPTNGDELGPNDELTFKIIESAHNYLGTPYRYGGTTPEGFDCSGFVRHVFNENGIKMGRSDRDLAQQGINVPLSALKPGDLIFFNMKRHKHPRIDHVGLYIGDGQFIHADPSRSSQIRISDLKSVHYHNSVVTARRVIAADTDQEPTHK